MANNIVTNADDVDLTIESADNAPEERKVRRVNVNEFTISIDQDITSEGIVGQNAPAGLSKGDLEYSFSFTVVGDNDAIMDIISDSEGDSLPFTFTARRVDGDAIIWEYSLETCLADTEEISGTTGETLEISVEGLGVGFDKDGVYKQ